MPKMDKYVLWTILVVLASVCMLLTVWIWFGRANERLKEPDYSSVITI